MAANPVARLKPAISLVSKVAAGRSPRMALLKMEANPAGTPQAGYKPGQPGGSKPVPGGQVNRPDGGKTVRTQNGNTLQYNKTGQLDRVVTSHGTVARYNPQGGVRTIHTANGTTVFRTPGGQRQVTTVYRGPNGQINGRVVTTGTNRGYAERTYYHGGATYMRRTYVYGGHTTVAVYRGYGYHGVTYYRYVPPYYYRPAFYGWGYRPWGPAVVYTGWGWYGSPWYRSYGYYFAPYPVYPSAAFWLTDYLIAQNLQAAYAAQAAAAANANAAAANANAAAANANAAAAQAQYQAGAPQPQQTADAQVTLTPEVKELIAQEVQRQLAAQQAAAEQTAANGTAPAPDAQPPTTSTDDVPAALDPNLRVFVVTTSLDVNVNGEACTLSPGDVLMRTETTPRSGQHRRCKRCQQPEDGLRGRFNSPDPSRRPPGHAQSIL